MSSFDQLASPSLLRRELCFRAEEYARKHALPHCLTYGANPVVAFEPHENGHGNFLPETYAAILANPNWRKRLNKVHSSARTSLPKTDRRWCELDSCNSSDALLMNVFCHPETFSNSTVRLLLAVEDNAVPEFGFKPRIPLTPGKFDRTEVDMRLGTLLVEAKLTESDFQSKSRDVVNSYRDFAEIFDRRSLPQTFVIPSAARNPYRHDDPSVETFVIPRSAATWNPYGHDNPSVATTTHRPPARRGTYRSYQLIRNVLAAHHTGSSFCVLCDARRPDLISAWYDVMRCVKPLDLRLRCKVLTWQELSEALPHQLQEFLRDKYGISSQQ